VKPAFDNFTEPKTDRRKFILGLLFCSAAGVAAWRQPSVKLDYLGTEKLGDLVPKTSGPWSFVAASGLVIPPEEQMEQVVYSQLLTRVYSDGTNPPIMVLLAQSAGQTGFLQIHRPDFCYTASGYSISAVTPHRISVGPKLVAASSMDANGGGPTEHVIYWTRVGDRMPTSWKAQKWAVAEQNLRGIIPDAILVRISTVSDDGDAARATIDNFVRAFIASIPLSKRAVFIA
jgi:EpsI family protein